MADKTDNNIRSDNADSGRNVDEKREATVLATSGPVDDPDVFLVEYPDGTQAYEPATPMNVALFRDGLYDELQGATAYSSWITGGETRVTLEANVENRQYLLTVGESTLPVPSEHHKDVIDAVGGDSTGSDLHELYLEILDGQVRRDVIELFGDRFPEDRVEQTASGWVVDDTFLVNYEAENYLVDDDTVYIRSGGDMVEADERKQAVELSFGLDGSREMESPDGTRIEVGEQEQQFLATVECLLYPEEYLNADLVDGVEQAKAESFTDDLESIAEQATVSGFTDTKTKNHHGHGFDKHRAIDEASVGTLDNSLGMTAEAVDMLYFNDYDHAACHELVARRQEFENAPFDIFEDADVANDDSTRWTAIERAKSSAPINQAHHQQIENMFGDSTTTFN